MANQKPEFEYFGWDEDPIGKYKQPKPSPHKMDTAGYPQTDINNEGIMVKGRWPAGTLKIKHMDMRGAGAATKGRKFQED